MSDSPNRTAGHVWSADPGPIWPDSPDPAVAAAEDTAEDTPTAMGDGTAPTETDGRRLRRALNREAVVDALLDLYGEGNLRPGTDEIAGRAGISPRSLFRYFEDSDDLAGEAITRQLGRVMPLLPLAVGPDAPFGVRVAALVDQRIRLFTTLGRAAQVSRLRAPFQPRLARNLQEGRRFLRNQVRTLFTTEMASMTDAEAEAALAAADVLASYESFQLLTGDRGMPVDGTRSVLSAALERLMTPAGTR